YILGVEDVNGDGFKDVVTANYGSGSGTSISVLLGNGNGTFQAKTDYTVGSGPYGVVIADLNGDGAVDLAVSNYTSNSISVLLGQNPAPSSKERYAVEGWNPAKSGPVGTENFDVWADLNGSSSLTTRYLRGAEVD